MKQFTKLLTVVIFFLFTGNLFSQEYLDAHLANLRYESAYKNGDPLYPYGAIVFDLEIRAGANYDIGNCPNGKASGTLIKYDIFLDLGVSLEPINSLSSIDFKSVGAPTPVYSVTIASSPPYYGGVMGISISVLTNPDLGDYTSTYQCVGTIALPVTSGTPGQGTYLKQRPTPATPVLFYSVWSNGCGVSKVGYIKPSQDEYHFENFTVTFNDNIPPTPGITTQATMSGDSIGSANMPSDTIRPCYTFGGWYFDVNDANSHFTGSTVVTKDTTVYAKWGDAHPTLTSDSQMDAICSGEAVDYEIEASQSATFTWTRVPDPDITSSGTGSGSGTYIDETLYNSTNSPIPVTYKVTIITPTPTCTVTEDVIVYVKPKAQVSATIRINH